MATRASSRTKSALSNQPGGGPDKVPAGGSSAVRDVVVHATRLELAALTSATKLVAAWAQSADRYVQAVSDELIRRVHGETPPGELVARLAVVSGTHLHEVSALPADAVSHFTDELTSMATPRTRRRQRAPRRPAR